MNTFPGSLEGSLSELKNSLLGNGCWSPTSNRTGRARRRWRQTAVPAEELDALTAGHDPLIEARELSVADKRRLQAPLAQEREIAETENQFRRRGIPSSSMNAAGDAPPRLFRKASSSSR